MIRRFAGSALVALVLLGVVPAAGRPTTRVEATTAAEEATAGSLAAMLRLMPALPLGGEAQATVTYIDVATQLATVGVSPLQPGDTATSEWVQATGWLKRLEWMGYAYEPEWREMFGFGLFEIEQAIEYAAPPGYLTIYRGRFDRFAVLAAWEREGYRAVEVNGATVYDDLDVELKLSGPEFALSSMYYAAIVADDTVAFASDRDVLISALDAAAGRIPSFADEVGVAPLLPNLPSRLVSAMIVGGAALADPAALATLDAAEAELMPPVVTALLGITAGAPLVEAIGEPIELPAGVPAARPIIALSFANQEEAGQAAAVIAERLATNRMPDDFPAGGLEGRPFAELFPHVLVRPDADETIVLIALGLADDVRPDILYQMLDWGALTFVAWSA